jgi:hypothetical protein
LCKQENITKMEGAIIGASIGTGVIGVGKGFLLFCDQTPTYIPPPYKVNRDIKGVYLYLARNEKLKGKDWENIVREFCDTELDTKLSGKGSIRIACHLVQGSWQRFVDWLKEKTHDKDQLVRLGNNPRLYTDTSRGKTG